MTDSQELERVAPGEIEIVDEPLGLDAAVERIAAVFSGAVDYEPVSVDAAAVTQAIFEQTAMAETEEDLWREPTTWSSKDHVGELFAFSPRGNIWPSTYTDANTKRKGAFLSVEATHVETGETGIFNTSSPRIAARLAWYARKGKLPIVLRVVERSKSSQGYPILDLERPEA